MRHERWVVILHPLGPSTISCDENWKFVGKPPRAMRHGRWVVILHPLGPSTGTAQQIGICTLVVILSEARSAKSKDLRIFPLHSTKQVRSSFDSLRSLRMTAWVVNSPNWNLSHQSLPLRGRWPSVSEVGRGAYRFAEMLVDIEHSTALFRQPFGLPPSPEGKALASPNFNFSATFAEKTEPHNAAPHWYALYRFSREARY